MGSLSQSVRLFSPSKLNLFFRVLRKREDGYHEIASLFQTIDLGDAVHVALSERDRFTCSDESLATTSNLVIKARELFRSKTGIRQFYNVHLTKCVPMQAGLGGGSGNAASALWAFNQLAGHPATINELIKWSSELGSDVPFFFSNGTAFCRGRGEILENVEPLQETSLWIAKPKEGLSTKLVYENYQEQDSSSLDPHDALQTFLKGTPCYFNDLERSAFQLLPSLSDMKKRLLDLGFTTVVMTGSGTAFFCLGEMRSPSLENSEFFKVNFIRRQEGNWYECN
ncbi:MAG TPA: 4-(cytidine 5'-diphospho)-2-C-methyl-D-erythritol kinase [Rhabdochlamydiaceae bacterium]|nr:4-(cytidine 5'-diphospho)-2-C-methyl-D-erythritol kinase [Rhabdochlamydiaceae bacterium]